MEARQVETCKTSGRVLVQFASKVLGEFSSKEKEGYKFHNERDSVTKVTRLETIRLDTGRDQQLSREHCKKAQKRPETLILGQAFTSRP